MPFTRKRKSRKVAYRKVTRSKAPRRTKPMVRRYSRSKPSGKARALRAKWANPMALSSSCKFHYADEGFSVATLSASGYLTHYFWSGNSIYDPDTSGVGVQPYGYDNLVNANQFPYYRVLASAIRLKFYATEAFHNVVITLIPLGDVPPTYTDLNDLKAIPGARQVYASSDSKGIFTLKHYWRSKTAHPLKNIENLSGQYNSNPADRWYWACYVDSSTIATEISMKVDCQIEYYTKLYKGDDANES